MERQRDELDEAIAELQEQLTWGEQMLASMQQPPRRRRIAANRADQGDGCPATPPRTKDMQFVLHDVLKVAESDIPGYDELDRDFTAGGPRRGGQARREVLAPLNRVGDTEGCRLENGVVRTPTGFKDAFDQMREGGWIGLDADPSYGGQGMPYLLHTRGGRDLRLRQHGLQHVPGPDPRRYSAIHAHGIGRAEGDLPAEDGRRVEWTGTMNLTEPQCGTDLGLIRTKAEPQDDGTYRITGQKIFISAGEHDLAENIIHLVLAKHPRRARGHQGHLALHRAEVPGERRRQPRRPQRGDLWQASKRRWASTATPPA